MNVVSIQNRLFSLETHHDTASDNHILHHWKHGLIMSISFGLILPLSLILFYFGKICKLSDDVRKYIHYIGFILTFILGIIGLIIEMILLKGIYFITNHSIIGFTLLFIIFISIMTYSIMRRYKFGLKIWCDFILCFLLLSLAFYQIISGLSLENNNIKNANAYIYLIMIWFILIIIICIIASIYIYLTQTKTEWSMIIAKGDDIDIYDEEEDDVDDQDEAIEITTR